MKFNTLLMTSTFVLSAALGYAQQWKPAAGPSAGAVNYTGRIGNTFYAAADRGLYVSHDMAKTWQLDTTVIKANWAVRALVTAGNTIIASSDHGTFTSLDGGINWTEATINNQEIPVLFRIVHNGNSFLAQMENQSEAIISKDGLAWSSRGASFDVGVSDKIFYRSIGSDLERSLDDGQNWLQVNATANGFDHVAGNSKYVFAGSGNLGLFRSADSGKIFTSITGGLPSGGFFVQALHAGEDTIWLSLLSATEQEIYYSADDGNQWQKATTGAGYKPWAMDIYADKDVLIAANPIGVRRSTDGGKNWDMTTSYGINNASVSDILHHDNKLYLATSESFGVFRSGDMGRTFEIAEAAMTLPNTNPRYLGATDNMLFLYTDNKIFRSSDGLRWVNTKAPFPVMVSGMLGHRGSILAATFSEGLLKSDDDGNTWTAPIINTMVLHIQRRGNTLYATTGQGTVLKSNDDGNTWTDPGNAGVPPFSGIIGFHAAEKYLFLTIGEDIHSRVFRSADSAASWQEITANLPVNLYNKITSNGDTVIISTDDLQNGFDNVAMLRSSDNGLTWTDLTAAIYPLRDILSLEYINGVLFAGLEQGGLWYYGDLPVTGILSPGITSLDAIRVYPNPATNTIQIKGERAAEIYIYDLSGKVVTHAPSSEVISVKDLPAANYIAIIRDVHRTVIQSTIITKQ